MAVSLREVAARAGVARGTVSCVLNNRAAEVRISTDTQARIRRIAEEMGYRPNRLAQGLGKGRTNVIGLMIPGLRNPFFLSLMEMAEEQAFGAGYDVLTDSAFQMRASYRSQSRLAGWPIDGVLIWVRPNQSLASYLGTWTADVPVVYLGYQRDDGADYVAIDRDGGVRQVMQHLRERGYRRIAYLYPWRDLQPVDARYVVYEAVCREAGQTPEQLHLETLEPQDRLSLITQAGLREAGLKTGLSLAARPAGERPDAVICHNDLVAVGVFHGLRRGGLRIPQDMAVVGFDGIEEGQYLDKPLTTVVSPGRQLIADALDVLALRLQPSGATDAPSRQILLPSVLRVGQTS